MVGARRIRRARAAFPEPGSKLEPSVDVGPSAVVGTTEVVDADQPWRLELDTRVKAFHARIVFELTQDPTGTVVNMDETVWAPLLVYPPLSLGREPMVLTATVRPKV